MKVDTMRLLWQQIPNSMVSELLCVGNTFDGVVLDTEHGHFTVEAIVDCIRVINLSKKLSFVRVTCLDQRLVRIILDSGANGIVFSTVETVEQAINIVKYCYYPPVGIRGQGLVRENLWGNKDFEKRKPIIVGQIETSCGVDNLWKSRGNWPFDYFLTGPYDLSASLGCLGQFEHPNFKYAMERFNDSVKPEMRGYHIVKDVDKQYAGLKDCGLLAFSIDTRFILDGIKRMEDVVNG